MSKQKSRKRETQDHLPRTAYEIVKPSLKRWDLYRLTYVGDQLAGRELIKSDIAQVVWNYLYDTIYRQPTELEGESE